WVLNLSEHEQYLKKLGGTQHQLKIHSKALSVPANYSSE
ncbi:MAG: 3-oxoadipate CoA-transferase, partial [Deltaproteobacteria bacterium]|nr:3-oxoadipate CoA-transferase [Deltaproteobacteria bacterium]